MNISGEKEFLEGPYPGPLSLILEGDRRDSVRAFEQIRRPPYSFFLESVKGASETARFSFMGTEPVKVIKSKGSLVEIVHEGHTSTFEASPLKVLREHLEPFSIPRPEGFPPFFGGVIGFLGYDLVRFMENLPSPGKDDLDCPDLCLLFVDTFIVFDHQKNSARIVHMPLPDHAAGKNRELLLKTGTEKIRELETRLKQSPAPGPTENTGGASGELPPAPEPNMSRDEYFKMVERCKEYIAAGDIYQANLSQRFSSPYSGDPWELYKTLREINPSPFAGYLHLDDLHLVSASPERLVRLNKGVLETRPIAGTRPRGLTGREDEGMRVELLTSEKERAEHLMLVDLERNDLGRVCRTGTVTVNELMITEGYSHVIHIVSNIQGQLSPGLTPSDVIEAVFPGGTITGVPKVRCMQIIDELEPAARGPYTGSFGYISLSGEMDLNIIIRTFVIKDGKVHIQVGGGIVADSDPAREYDETIHKAAALMKALYAGRTA